MTGLTNFSPTLPFCQGQKTLVRAGSLTDDVIKTLHHRDPDWHRQSPRPSLRVFILKELNAAGGSGLACETSSSTS